MPLLWLSAAFLAGILLGSALRLPWWAWGIAMLAGIAWSLIERRVPRLQLRVLRRFLPVPAGVLLAAVFFGALRWQSAQPAWGPDDLAFYNGSGESEITGWVASYPDERDNAVLLTVRAESIRLEGQSPVPVRGQVLVRLPAGAQWQYGDRVVLQGKPFTPPKAGDFSYRDYLARQGIYTYLINPAVHQTGDGDGAGSQLMAAIYRLRQYAYQTLNRIFPQPEAALFSGVLLGLERDLPESIVTAFQDTGTSHIVAISGFNMTILSALLIALLGRFLPRGWAAVAAAAAIGGYTLLVGANPAVVRAAVMGSLALFGRLIGRGSSGLTPLAFSAALMCLVNPLLPWDAGFQLSFTATLGLILYGEPLQRGFGGWASGRWGENAAKKLAGPVSEYFLFTLAAQVTTLPVILAHFGRLSLTALLANPLILPVQPALMILGGLALIAGMILPVLGQILGWLAWPLAAYTLKVVEALAKIRSGAVSIDGFTTWTAAAAYGLLFGLTLGGERIKRLRQKLSSELVLAGFGLAVMVTWSAALRRPDGNLHILLPDTPDSQAALLQLPGGGSALIGGADSGSQLGSELGRLTGPLHRRLDTLVLPSADSTSLNALPAVIERFQVEQAWWAVAPPDKRAAERVSQALIDAGVEPGTLAPGTELQLDRGVILRVLAADGESAALQLEYENLCLLWPGGKAPEQLAGAGERLSGCIILADGELDASAWAGWQPLSVVYIGNQPLPEPGALSTSRNGQIEIISDGERLWVEVSKHGQKD